MKRMLFLAALMNLIVSTSAIPRGIPSGLSAAVLQNDSSPLLVSFSNGKLYKLDINTGEESLLFDPLYTPRQNPTVAPNNELVAFAETKAGIFHTREARRHGRYDVWAKAFLRVIGPDGRLLHTLEDGLKYAWSPDGNKIAYVTYDLNDADYTFKSPTGLWIYDLATGERKKIARYAYRLKWAEFDKNLYFTQRRTVLRYNTKSGGIDTTAYTGTDFSPDGKYYFGPDYPPVGKRPQIYDTATNQIQVDVYKLLAAKHAAQGAHIKIIDWMQGRNSLLLMRATTTTNPPPLRASEVNYRVQISQGVSVEHFLFDVETSRVIKEFEGLPSKWVGNGQAIAVERGGKVVLEGLPDKQ